MTSKHVLRISSINEFFQNDNKIIKKGENALESNYVKTMQCDADLMLIRGEIHASMKDKVYTSEINWALFGHYNIFVTDKKCTWNAPKESKMDPVQTADELYPSKLYLAIEEKLSIENKQRLKNKLGACGNTVGFTWLLQDESTETVDNIAGLPLIEEIISSQEFCDASGKREFMKQKCAVDEGMSTNIASLTVGQVSNDKWYLVRKFRLTASTFGAVIGACKRNRYPDSLFKNLMGSYNLDGIKAIQWGQTHERDGIQFLKDNLNIDIQTTGIWLSNSGLLGASPDGLVGDDAIVEVKCPYSFRNDKLSEKLLNYKMYIIYYGEKGDIFVNTNHNYYHQIQGYLHILERSKCYLCIWTLKEVVAVSVECDPSWNENFQLLENFYLSIFLPKLLEYKHLKRKKKPFISSILNIL